MRQLVRGALIALAVVTAGACQRPVDPQAVTIPEVAVIRPQRRTAIYAITLPGDLVGYYESALHAKVTGYLQHIYVDKGDWVKTGQVLAQIEVPELADNLDRAQAQLTIAKLTYERLKSVRDSDPRLVAQQDVDLAFSKFQAAKADVGIFRTMMDYTRIVAPFDGVITGRFADPGALIRAAGSDIGINGAGANLSAGASEGAAGAMGGPLLTIAKIDRLRVYVYVPERAAGMIQIGTPAIIRVRAFPNQPIAARVTRFATSLDLDTRTMLTELDIANPENRLYPRMYADVTLNLTVHPDALELPVGAVGGLSGPENDLPRPAYVYLADNGRLTKTNVTAGISDGRFVEIVAGLNRSDLVASDASPALSDGQRIKPILTAQHEANSSQTASLQ